MRLLLDTHVFLWLQQDPDRLGEQLRLVEDSRNDLLVSAASSWEIAIKVQLGKLVLPDAPERYVPRRIHAIGALAIPIEHSHVLAVTYLPPLHRDPFDRLLIAQTHALDLVLLTADEAVAAYPVATILVGGRPLA